ncbi:MAG: hypothetical protein CMB97_01355 [Flavobacteriaceae bacterium]|nr:hypothetical protein [Flavobacteriaceae bacterium]
MSQWGCTAKGEKRIGKTLLGKGRIKKEAELRIYEYAVRKRKKCILFTKERINCQIMKGEKVNLDSNPPSY